MLHLALRRSCTLRYRQALPVILLRYRCAGHSGLITDCATPTPCGLSTFLTSRSGRTMTGNHPGAGATLCSNHRCSNWTWSDKIQTGFRCRKCDTAWRTVVAKAKVRDNLSQVTRDPKAPCSRHLQASLHGLGAAWTTIPAETPRSSYSN